MLQTDLHDQKTILKLLREKLMEQSGYKASGEESVDKYMASSGKAKHKKTPHS